MRPDLLTDATASTLAAIGVGEQRWAAHRIAGLAAAERRLYGQILHGFVDGRPVSPAELASGGGTDGPLRTLVGRDLVGLGADGEVAVAYPFSATPTRHRVRLSDGRAYWAMCAIDALGIPDLVERPAQIDAREPGSDRPISVRIAPDGTPSWTPAEAVVVAAASGAGCTSGCACPHINLFSCAADGERYLARPDLRGTILTVPEATAVGRRLFGDLLHRLNARAR
jgi:hypothetical protein